MHYRTKKMICDAIRKLSSFVYNLLYFVDRSPAEKEFADLRNFVLSLPESIKEHYAEECRYLESMSLDNLASIFIPYEETRKRTEEEVRCDRESGLPFVLHKGKSKVFFPRCTSLAEVRSEYCNLVDREGLLGTGLKKKSPHCYQDSEFKVEQGDVLLDVGCAEAIFAVDNIDVVSKVYLFESSSEWRSPLKKTFAPYSHKAVLINKFVSDKTNAKETKLIDVIAHDLIVTARFFVKMDIEGAERLVIKGNEDFFKTAKVKLSCCVYHRQDDAENIGKMLKELGYAVRFSDGYMLPTMNGVHYPYFRYGVIYAQNY